MEHKPADWAKLTEVKAGRVAHTEFSVMLQLHYVAPTLPGKSPAPVQTTPPLFLTTDQAKDLLLLLGHALQFPGTGIPEPPTKSPH